MYASHLTALDLCFLSSPTAKFEDIVHRATGLDLKDFNSDRIERLLDLPGIDLSRFLFRTVHRARLPARACFARLGLVYDCAENYAVLASDGSKLGGLNMQEVHDPNRLSTK